MKNILKIALFFIFTSLLNAENIKIAYISSPKVIGSYSQSLYSIAITTAIAKKTKNIEIINISLADESKKSIENAMLSVYDAIIAPLTANGAKNLLSLELEIPIFIPTLHKREFADASENVVFGAIDYKEQIRSLLSLSGNNIHIFYDQSAMGEQLKSLTQQLITEGALKKQIFTYAINAKGDNITKHFKSSAKFNNSTVILHLPIVKSALIASYMRATKIREKSILSTQIIYDPSLLGLIQSENHKNMTIANSIIEQNTDIFEANEVLGNNILYNWMGYATSIGADYLISKLSNSYPSYNLQIADNQIIYPIELTRPQEFGFESISK